MNLGKIKFVEPDIQNREQCIDSNKRKASLNISLRILIVIIFI